MADSHDSHSESVNADLANVHLDGSDSDSTAETFTPVGSVDSTHSATSLTHGLPSREEVEPERLTHPSEAGAASSTAGSELLPLDGMVTVPMLESYLQKLLKNIPLTTEETKFLCERVRRAWNPGVHVCGRTLVL